MANTIRGKIEAIEAIQSIPSKKGGEPFLKRRLLLDATRFDGLTGERGSENHVIIDFNGKNVNVPDTYKAGDFVEISFSLEGNKYVNQDGKTSYFVHARGYRIEPVGHTAQQTTTSLGAQQSTSQQDAQPFEGNDMPF